MVFPDIIAVLSCPVRARWSPSPRTLSQYFPVLSEHSGPQSPDVISVLPKCDTDCEVTPWSVAVMTAACVGLGMDDVAI
jgi:hypothetical protein